jgi:hypothetical protein
MDVDIFFAFDALNGGTIINDNTMMLNTMFWPSKETYLPVIEGILLHEYHHIGLFYWMRKYDENFDKYDDSKGLLRYLIISIIGEGAATYFYNDGDDMYPLIIESHGQEVAEATRSAMANRGNNMSLYMKNLDKDYKYIMTSSDELNEKKSFINKYLYASGGEPLDKSIGYHMCQAIEEKFGLNKLIECFENPDLFLSIYNDSLSEDSDLRVSKELIDCFVK